MPSSKIDWLSSNETPNGCVFAPVVAAPGGEIDPPARQQVERRPLLGDPDRMVQRQHRHRRREPDALVRAATCASTRSGQDRTPSVLK